MRNSKIKTLLFLLMSVLLTLSNYNCTQKDFIGPSYKLHGLNFSPYLDGQDPNLGTIISEKQLSERLQVIALYTTWVRTFGSTHGLEQTGRIAHAMDLKIAAGAWLDNNLTTNEQEISNLIEIAINGEIDMAIVGSEVLLRGDLSEDQLINYINQVRQAIPKNIPVTTADVCGILINHPNVIAAVDQVFVNHFPYWEGVKIDCAIYSLHNCHEQLIDSAHGKPVIVSETGWPSCGETIGDAIPSSENASFYFLNFISWARENNVSYFYFSAFDESWKSQYEGPQGACWGIWNTEGSLKPGMQSVFDNKSINNNWNNDNIIGGPGNPSILFSHVPEYGSFDNLSGSVLHIKPVEFRIAVYIYVGGWWTKPYFSRPLTNISCDGSWLCDITTGGSDQRATEITAYLLPNSYNPPLLSGNASLPEELNEHSVAVVSIKRNP